VGERGLKLSGAELQRVAIACALHADAEVLFLDEASSALDERTEAEIISELKRLAGERIIIAITHRQTVIVPGDNIAELAEGPSGSGSPPDALGKQRREPLPSPDERQMNKRLQGHSGQASHGPDLAASECQPPV
jgi:ABC-type transport system involved in cytochrome bd biosynthesis fused ATPase/permease subunit